MTVEQRLDQLEKRNKRLTVGLTMMAVAMCAVVTMAATGLKDGTFDTVTARSIWVTNDTGDIVVVLDATVNGNGVVLTQSTKGKRQVMLTSTVGGQGKVNTYHPNGKALVELGASDNGGMVTVYNKTGDGISQMYADEYGNGVVYAGNRKGEGRMFQPGP